MEVDATGGGPRHAADQGEQGGLAGAAGAFEHGDLIFLYNSMFKFLTLENQQGNR